MPPSKKQRFFYSKCKLISAFLFTIIFFYSELFYSQVFIPVSFWRSRKPQVITVFTSTNASWSVPADWSNTDNSIECIGGGGGGGGSGDGSSTANNGGNGANYGGGGGGLGRQSSGSSVGSGAAGVCVIKYRPD